MSTAVLIPVEEYLRYTGKPYREYRAGKVEEKAMPTGLHGLLQLMLGLLLRKQGLRAAPELTVRLSAETYLIPDLVANPTIPAGYPTEPVFLCCEILSPGDGLGALFSKCEEYHEWGVPHCWVIDPVKRTAWQYAKGGEPEKVPVALTAGEFKVELTELFSILDEAEPAAGASAPRVDLPPAKAD